MPALRRTLRLLVLVATTIAAALAVIAVGAGAASADVVERIQFAPGADHASVSGAVVRGDRDTYVLEARAGQTLVAELGSVEDNARFDLAAPDGLLLCVEETHSRIILPQDGYYAFTVASSRGNATYNLFVRII